MLAACAADVMADRAAAWNPVTGLLDERAAFPGESAPADGESCGKIPLSSTVDKFKRYPDA